MMKRSLALLLPLTFSVQAQDVSELPGRLFDIELGGVYEYATEVDGGSAGTFPVRRLMSEQVSLNKGLSVYFEPLRRGAGFPFDEFTLDNGDRISSFRFYVLPVLPEVTGTLAELEERNLPQKVLMIEWSQGASRIDNGDNYRWASDLCRSLEAEFGIEPEVSDIAEDGIYRCVFSSGDREMEISSVLGRTVQLSLSDEITDQMEGDVYLRIRRLELEEISRRRRQGIP